MLRPRDYTSDPSKTWLNRRHLPILDRGATATLQAQIDAIMAQAISINAQTATFTRATSAYDPITNTIKLPNTRRTRTVVINSTNYSADLIEINRTNLVAAGTSEHFERMTVGSGTPTVTTDATTAPTTETVADKLTEGAGTGLHSVTQSVTKAASALDYSVGVVVKLAAGTRKFRLQLDDGTTTNGVYVSIDPSAGTLVTAPTAFGSGWAAQTSQGTGGYTIADYGSGWYRITLTVTSDATTTVRILCALENAGSISYAGDSTSAVYLWGLTFEQAAFPSTIILNRNMLLQSDAFNSTWGITRAAVTANSTANPLDGTLTADTLTEDSTASATHQFNQSVTKATAALAVTLSIYAKAGTRSWIFLGLGSTATLTNGAGAYFDLTNGATGSTTTIGTGWTLNTKTITSIGSGWYRCVVTITTDANANLVTVGQMATADGTRSYSGNGTGTLILYGAQLEYGSTVSGYWATSTAGSRAADTLTVTFAPGTAQGTVYGVVIPNLWSVSPSVAGQVGTATALSGVSVSSNITVQFTSASLVNIARSDGVSSGAATMPSVLANRTVATVVGTWDAGGVNVYQNGVIGTPVARIPPYVAETGVTIGNLTGSARHIDGWVLFLSLSFPIGSQVVAALNASTSAA